MKTTITSLLIALLVGSFAYHLNVDHEDMMGMTSAQVSWIAMGFGALLVAFLVSMFSKEKSSKIALLVVAGILLAIIVRIVYDTSCTSSSHSLAGIEIFIYAIISLPTAYIGAFNEAPEIEIVPTNRR